MHLDKYLLLQRILHVYMVLFSRYQVILKNVLKHEWYSPKSVQFLRVLDNTYLMAPSLSLEDKLSNPMSALR